MGRKRINISELIRKIKEGRIRSIICCYEENTMAVDLSGKRFPLERFYSELRMIRIENTELWTIGDYAGETSYNEKTLTPTFGTVDNDEIIKKVFTQVYHYNSGDSTCVDILIEEE